MKSDRDRLPDSRRMHELVLTYTFSQAESGAVTIRVPELEGLLYDGPVVSQRWLLFDARKRLIAADDMYPAATTLEKGDYELRLQLLHPEADSLKPREQTLLAIDRELAAPIPVQAFSARAAVADRRPDFEGVWLDPGEQATAWFGAPRMRDVPETASPGDVLLGSIVWEQSMPGLSGADSRPDGFPVQYVIPARPTRSGRRDGSGEPAARGGKDQSTAERLADELLEFRLEQLSGLDWTRDKEQIERISQELLEAHEDARRRILVARLHLVDNDDREERLPEVVAAADAVIGTINRRRLARHFGMRPDPDQEKVNAEREAERTDLIDALYRKGRALGFMELPEVLEEHPIPDRAAHDKAFEQTLALLARWADTTDAAHFRLHVRRDRRRGHFAKAMQLLNQHSDAAREDKELAEKRRDVYEELGWNDWRDYEQRWVLIRFPAEYQDF
jgi:tripeptidyl-peptidase-2